MQTKLHKEGWFKMGKFQSVGKFSINLLLATLLTYCIASAMHSQTTLVKLSAVGIDIPFSAKLRTLWLDFSGLLPTYGLIILVGLLIAMLVAQLIGSKINGNKIWLYGIAGATAMAVILMSMQPLLNVTLISGARGITGLLAQSVAGAFGGTFFGWLKMRKP